MRKVPSALEAEIAGEKAAALGRSGRTLRSALEKLAKFDAGTARRGSKRAELVALAGEAYWAYVVQREAMGLVHNESIIEEYGIPPEVVRSMRPRVRSSR